MNWTRLATAVLTVAAVPALTQTVPALAQTVPVRISSPAPEQTVRGSVPISINTAAIPPSGYMTVSIFESGAEQPSEDTTRYFVAAVAPSTGSPRTTFVWDSKANLGETGAPPRDGQYTVRVKTYTADFRFVRSNELNVYLRNRISLAANKSITLKYKLRPDETLSFVERVTAKAAGVEVYSADVPITLEVNDVSDGVAEARERIGKTAAESASGSRQPMSVAGRSFLVRVSPTGAVTAGPRMKRAGVTPVLSMVSLPGHPVRIGDTWSSALTLSPFYNGVQSATVSATNKLTGLEYFGQHPAARIESTYDGAAEVVASGTPSSVRFKGTRVTYFDYVRGRLLRAEDNLTADVNAGAPGAGAMPGSPYGAGAGAATPGTAANLTIVTAAR